MTLTKSARFLFIAIISAFALVLLLPTGARAATCDFTRNLEKGDEGQDVLCLQKFLNSHAGYTIAATGAGSPGQETTQFGDKTVQALIKWQKANG
ncbi:MAG: peptidoglycan-binding protein, partial [Candidatus Pacebacteria bacterium]|nr:peptidoglycan-binding protein [Candidatus Paceibacterota bacterium]